MPTDDACETAAIASETRVTIARIARTLGCSVEDLTDTSRDPIGTRGASELLSIWAEMDNDGDRERLLAFARKLAMR